MSNGIKEKNERNADKPNASKKTNTPNMTPKTKKRIFMAISHINPSKSQVKIKPGNLIDHPATVIKTSLTNEAVKMQ
jgi:hypothetical protein